jgi:hypothetical protein
MVNSPHLETVKSMARLSEIRVREKDSQKRIREKVHQDLIVGSELDA